MPVDKFGHTDIGMTQRIVAGGVTVSQVDETFLRRDGANSATEDIDLDSHKLVNVLDPTGLQDAATKNYVDTIGLKKLSKSGDTVNGNLLVASSAVPNVNRMLGCIDLLEGQRFSLLLGNDGNKISYDRDDGEKIVLHAAKIFRVLINNVDVIEMAKPAGGATRIDVYKDINMHTGCITGLKEPTIGSDATTKNYVDARVIGPAFSAFSTVTQNIQTFNLKKVLFPTKVFDTNSSFDSSLSRFTPRKAGIYTVSAYIEFNSPLTTYFGLVRLYKNGIFHIYLSGGGGTGTAYTHATGGTIVSLNETDYLEIYATASINMEIFARNFSAAYLGPNI